MRILMVNWAKIWDGASRGGGVNGYAQALALQLVALGHDVSWLSAGDTYVPKDTHATPGPVTIRRYDDWFGIRVFDVVNSPVLAPGIHQFRRPIDEIANESLEREVRAFAVRLRPDVVHPHNIEGLTCACVGAFQLPDADWPGARVIYSLHNYHTICPQVYLMQRNRRPCHDYNNGNACTTCVDAPNPAKILAKRLTAALAEQGIESGKESHHERDSISLPGQPASTTEQLSTPRPPTRDTRGDAPAILARRAAAAPTDPRDLVPLTNDIRPAARPTGPPNDYAQRRYAMVAMLNRCDRVLAVSTFVRRKFESMGVDPARLSTMPIGTRAIEIVAEQPEMLADPPPFDPPRPIRLVFLGHNNYFKGLPMLADVLDNLGSDMLAHLDLTIAASAFNSIAPRFRRLRPRLAALTIHRNYTHDDIPTILFAKDLGIVPSVWWDNGPQTVFEFLSCGVPVLGAAVGGIPDFLEDGVNAILFRANDRDDLSARLREIILSPERLQTLRKSVRPPKSMIAHAAEMADLYQMLLGAGPSRAKLH
jgi:glycosyltransferase involved in cell wall biosynthesis